MALTVPLTCDALGREHRGCGARLCVVVTRWAILLESALLIIMRWSPLRAFVILSLAAMACGELCLRGCSRSDRQPLYHGVLVLVVAVPGQIWLRASLMDGGVAVPGQWLRRHLEGRRGLIISVTGVAFHCWVRRLSRPLDR